MCLEHLLIKWKITVSSWQKKKVEDNRHKLVDVDYTNDIALLANTPTQAKTLLDSLKRAAAGIGLHINADKMEHMCFNQRGDISTLNGSSLKLVDKFTYLGNSVSSTETGINMRLAKAWTVINRLSVIWKWDLTNKIKHSLFQAIWMHNMDANKTYGEKAWQ